MITTIDIGGNEEGRYGTCSKTFEKIPKYRLIVPSYEKI
jgi:RNA polymerase-binding transcription factor DksA